MAKQIITKITDDIDGGDADETVTFALDGIGYEIDLSSKNSKKLRDFLTPYLEAGTRMGRVGNPAQLQRHRATYASSPSAPSAQQREQNQAIREWAMKNGHDVSERGRIPMAVVEAFHAKKAAGTSAAQKLEDEINTAAAAPAKKTRARAS